MSIMSFLHEILEELGILKSQTRKAKAQIAITNDKIRDLRNEKKTLEFSIANLEKTIATIKKQIESATGGKLFSLKNELSINQQQLNNELTTLQNIYNQLGINIAVYQAHKQFLDAQTLAPSPEEINKAKQEMADVNVKSAAVKNANEGLVDQINMQQAGILEMAKQQQNYVADTNIFYNDILHNNNSSNTETTSENTSESEMSQSISSPSDKEVQNMETLLENSSGNNLKPTLDTQLGNFKSEQM